MSTESTPTAVFITPQALLDHWQGHRRVTRRVIDAFPEDRLFGYKMGTMRSFGEMAMEIIGQGVPMVRGVVTGEWGEPISREARAKREILRLWDESTEQLNTLWPRIAPERFMQTIKAFGQWEQRVCDLILYVIDNEIHHRGQGTVYLSTLGIKTSFFTDRS
jgi:uncharacterized damage-inducible protein DinB